MKSGQCRTTDLGSTASRRRLWPVSPHSLRATVVVALVAIGACARTPPERALLDQMATALGGRDRVLGTTSLRLEGSGENFSIGQNRTVEGELPRYTVANYVRRYDFARNRSRLEQVRTPAFPSGNMAPVRQFISLDGDVAFTVSESGVVTRQELWVARERRGELRHTPMGIVRAALGETSKLGAPRVEEGFDVMDITEADGTTFTVFADRTTHLPARVRMTIAHPELGDVPFETVFDQYATSGGVPTPGVYTTTIDGHITARITVSSTTFNAGVEDLVAPPPVASSDPNPARATVVVEDVGPGLWYLTGQSHHSVVAEFADHLTIVEAPQGDARALAVIQRARELRPGKPVTQVIPSHHHFDHIGGVRAAISQGLTVVTPTATRAFFENLAGRPHRLVPDALEAAPKPAQLQTFDGELVLEDASMSLRVIPIEGSPHADPFLMVYFPKHRALFEVDAFTPAAIDAKVPPRAPFAKALLDAITGRKLVVDRILAGHGRIGTMKELEASVAATAAAASDTQR